MMTSRVLRSGHCDVSEPLSGYPATSAATTEDMTDMALETWPAVFVAPAGRSVTPPPLTLPSASYSSASTQAASAGHFDEVDKCCPLSEQSGDLLDLLDGGDEQADLVMVHYDDISTSDDNDDYYDEIDGGNGDNDGSNLNNDGSNYGKTGGNGNNDDGNGGNDSDGGIGNSDGANDDGKSDGCDYAQNGSNGGNDSSNGGNNGGNAGNNGGNDNDTLDAVHPRLCGGRHWKKSTTKSSNNNNNNNNASNVGGYTEFSCVVCSGHWPLWSMCERHAFTTGHGLTGDSASVGSCRLCQLPGVRHVCHTGGRRRRRVGHGCVMLAALRSLGVATVAAAVATTSDASWLACCQCGARFGNSTTSPDSGGSSGGASHQLVEHLFSSGHGVLRQCRRCRLPVLNYLQVKTSISSTSSKEDDGQAAPAEAGRPWQMHVCLGSGRWLSKQQRALLPPATPPQTQDKQHSD